MDATDHFSGSSQSCSRHSDRANLERTYRAQVDLLRTLLWWCGSRSLCIMDAGEEKSA